MVPLCTDWKKRTLKTHKEGSKQLNPRLDSLNLNLAVFKFINFAMEIWKINEGKMEKNRVTYQ